MGQQNGRCFVLYQLGALTKDTRNTSQHCVHYNQPSSAVVRQLDKAHLQWASSRSHLHEKALQEDQQEGIWCHGEDLPLG